MPTTTLPVRFVIPRVNSPQPTICIVEANVNKDTLRNKLRFLSTLQIAVTEWSQTSRTGKRARREQGSSVNCEALSHYQLNADLKRILLTQGIEQLVITPYRNIAINWHYDTNLVLNGTTT